jgi:hypothetical protein
MSFIIITACNYLTTHYAFWAIANPTSSRLIVCAWQLLLNPHWFCLVQEQIFMQGCWISLIPFSWHATATVYNHFEIHVPLLRGRCTVHFCGWFMTCTLPRRLYGLTVTHIVLYIWMWVKIKQDTRRCNIFALHKSAELY